MKASISIISLFLIISLFYLPPVVTGAYMPDGGIDPDLIDAAITGQMAKHGLPGVAVAVIDKGEVVYQQGYGVDGNGSPITPYTRMYIGSQSKSFTALAIAQLVEQGKLDINAPVQRYIPWFKVADEKASQEITLNHLLHHTSGLSDAGFGSVLPLNTSNEAAVRALSTAKLTEPVGTRFQYFNMGYTVLAYLVELASGQSYAEYIQEHILTPLEMLSSSADPSTVRDLPKGFTRLFGFPVPAKEDLPQYAVGAGFIVSSAVDMAKYAIQFQTNSQKLVSDEMSSRILSPGIGNYGMGWFIYDNGRRIVHGGANQTFHTEVNLYPELDRAFVLLTNEGHQLDHFISASQLTAGVEAVVLQNTLPARRSGWSVRWVGWAIGLFVLGLCVFQTRNFLSLRSWKARMRGVSAGKKVFDIAISFLIPIAITIIVFWQVSTFYGNRFNLISSLAYMRQGMPDIFILMMAGTLPDITQGIVKLFLVSQK